MTTFVDDMRHRFGRMIMCHLWADTLDELLAMADRIGVQRKWLQQPPKASWVHFDISLAKKALAIKAGAVLTDRYGPVEFMARQRGDARVVENIRLIREARNDGFRYDAPVADPPAQPYQPAADQTQPESLSEYQCGIYRAYAAVRRIVDRDTGIDKEGLIDNILAELAKLAGRP